MWDCPFPALYIVKWRWSNEKQATMWEKPFLVSTMWSSHRRPHGNGMEQPLCWKLVQETAEQESGMGFL